MFVQTVGNFKMTSSELNKFLDGNLTVDEFNASIADEAENYRRLMTKKGSTVQLQLIEDEEITLDKLKLKKMFDFVIAGQLSNIQLAYICDCLTLAERLRTDEETKDMIFEIADPEINRGYLDKEALRHLISKIN